MFFDKESINTNSMNTLGCEFAAVIDLPENYEVYDFTKEYNPHRELKTPYGIGKYNEKRPGMYTDKIFTKDSRNIHIGIDIGAPVGTEVKSFYHGEIFLFAYNDQPGDYGYTLITKHCIHSEEIYALYGHLSQKSLRKKMIGQQIQTGEVLGWVGDKSENGGWNSHLHFQLSRKKPKLADMPGVVAESFREQALKIYPDPRIVLGDLY